jgi:hypothetical protein
MPDFTVVSKPQVCLTSTRSRHWSVDGDCVLRPKHTGGFDNMMGLMRTIRPHGTVAATGTRRRPLG